MANAIYQIKTANGALALEVVNTTLQLGNVTGADNQKWEMTGEKDGQVSFINVESKTAIDVAMMGTENGTPVHVWQVLDDALTQKWMIQGEKIVSAFAADKVLDAGMFPSEGSTLQLWDDVDGDSQKWVLVDLTPAPKKAPAKKGGRRPPRRRKPPRPLPRRKKLLRPLPPPRRKKLPRLLLPLRRKKLPRPLLLPKRKKLLRLPLLSKRKLLPKPLLKRPPKPPSKFWHNAGESPGRVALSGFFLSYLGLSL